ncbi:MAG TPA: LTA synthase family protein [Vicinamibacterales bacterium]|nr:LTA synthase family protein [Vicinamibacterales bacterium]
MSGRLDAVNRAFVTAAFSRWRLVATLLVAQLAVWSALRLVLFAMFRDSSVTPWQFPSVMATGAAFDLLTGLTALLPVTVAVSVLRLRWLARPALRHTLMAGALFVLCFDAFVQFLFFEEYSARYNHLALDYLMYPDEVFGNIFASYNVPLYVALAALAAAGLTRWTIARPAPVFGSWTWRDRAKGGGLAAALATGLWVAWTIAPNAVGPNRVAGELALNGWAELVRAYVTSHLDYEAYYATLPPAEAELRVARLVGQPVPTNGLTRHFTPHGRRNGPPLDVVIIMEESLGSSFSARFGGETEEPVTPELDRWSHEGLALTNVIATGNRTVRGMEGILCSFLPVPPDSIVKRDRSDNVASIARILATRGYLTSFVIGGYGLFDNVKAFVTTNGYQEFVEQPDYPAEAFRTVWGVADEFVFDALIERQKAARRQGRPWLGTALTVSNHKPFDVPPGRVSWPAGRSARRGAVRYADWALGHYLSRAREEGLLERTVVLIVGDHGARVYGAEEIPVGSYRIPAVFLTPDPSYRGATLDRLASQVDLAPTLLSLAGIDYEAPFFGRDLLGLPAEGGRAFVNHNRSVGLLTDSALVVLGLHRSVAFYTRTDRTSDEFHRATGETPPLRDLASDAEAAFQTAYEYYRGRRYSLGHGT